MIRRLLKKIIYGTKASSKSYINYLCKIGANIGEGTVIYSPTKTLIDETRPFLIHIGKNVQICQGVSILTHGYDWSVIKGKYGEVIGSSGGVTIGDNVFIGVNTTILKGTRIGNNTIVGANSLVSGEFPNDIVIGGNPARILMTLEEYYIKRKEKQFSEAAELVLSYRTAYNKEPSDEDLNNFFWLFSTGNESMPKEYIKIMNLLGNSDVSYKKMKSRTPKFSSKEEFLKSIK